MRGKLCWLLGHDLRHYFFASSKALVECVYCKKRWIMNSDHYYRYDNDPEFIQELKEKHPELRFK